MPTFVTFGRIVLNVEHVCSITRSPEGQVIVRMTNLGATEEGGVQSYTPGEHVFSGPQANQVWEYFTRPRAEVPTTPASHAA